MERSVSLREFAQLPTSLFLQETDLDSNSMAGGRSQCDGRHTHTHPERENVRGEERTENLRRTSRKTGTLCHD